MGLVLLCLLISLRSHWTSASGTSTAGSISTVCGADEVVYDGKHLFINSVRVHKPSLVCEKLNSCFNYSQFEEWEGVFQIYCKAELRRLPPHGGSIGKVVRKLLRDSSQNASNIDNLKRELPLQESDDDIEVDSEGGDLQFLVPGIIFLSCGFLVPCFGPRRKDSPNKNTALPTQFNLDSASFEVSASSDKVPATPYRVPPSPSRFAMSPHLSRAGSVQLSIQQIVKATQNFSPQCKLGEGGFGTVYRAGLPDGQVVAIKRAKKEQYPGPNDEFSNEVELLAKIDHRNLVRLLGYTDNGNERIIITEYVPNGTLREHLDGQHGKILDFNQRLEIAIDVAHALTYLHLFAEKTIIHRDVKSSNILLTENYRAKVSDFGFAKSGPSDAEKTHISTKVKGTAGYLDPEYLRTYQLTPKSDVFSFGILLTEILSGRRPVELKRSAEEKITIRWAFKRFNEGNGRMILDPLLEEQVDDEVLDKLLYLAFQCAAPTREDRPDMNKVGEQLWEIRKEYLKSIKRP